MNCVENRYPLTTSKAILLVTACLLWASVLHAELPHFEKNPHGATQLMVHGKPFLMIAGETNNSSGSHIPHMEKTMKALREANLNSLFVTVSWEIIEPQEGVFNFTPVDELLRIARENDLKLGILWFCLLYTSPSPRDRS